MSNAVYLAGGARTAVATFCGAFESVPATSLGSTAVKAAIQRAGVPADQVQEVIMGVVLSAGLGQNPARQAAIGAGLSPAVGATTINKLCGSGLKSIMMAAQAIKGGDASLIVAGGMENMSRAPYLLDKARSGYKMGNSEVLDTMFRDGLWDSFGNNVHMGTCGDRCAEKYGLTREAQDDFAVASFQRAIEAAGKGYFGVEIEPVAVKAGKETVMVKEDENLKKFNEEKLRKLRPAFGPTGTVTAGNASSINDGAAAFAVIGEQKMKELGIKPQAKILAYSTFSREPEWFTLAPIGALQNVLKMLDWKVSDVDLFELNEAFAAVPMAAMQELGIPHDKLNVHGGAVALGHPIGASGARTLATLLNAMRVRGARRGINALCIGGGEAVAMAVELC